MSSLSVGIVGLPNVGKSSLFNALTRQQIPAENYPFCTIDPNVGIVPVPDERLQKIAEIEKSAKIVPAVVQFVDIAGLVKGASKGEGLGNQFLTHIKEVDLIVHVLRFFEGEKVTHVEKSVDPKRDKEIIEMELMLKDLESVAKRLERVGKESRVSSKDSEIKKEEEFWKRIAAKLEKGETFKPSEIDAFTDDEKLWLRDVPLLSTKKVIFLANVNSSTNITREEAAAKIDVDLNEHDLILMDILQEADLSVLSDDERVEYIKELGLEETGLNTLIKRAYTLLGLATFLTAGDTEARAWTIKAGMKAADAAGVIHTDFTKKFIAMDVIKYPDFVENNGWAGSKGTGKIHLEGRDYIVEDGDVVLIKHG